MMNIMNPPADWSTLKKLIWLRGTPINGGEELTVSGTPPLSLPNSLGKPLKAWSVDVVPYQEGTGDPSPDNVRAIHGTDKIGVYVGSPNIWDEEWEVGQYSPTTGQPIESNNAIRSKNLIPVVPNSTIRFVFPVGISGRGFGYESPDSTSFVTFTNVTYTIPSNIHYIKFHVSSGYGDTYRNDIAVNLPSTESTYNQHTGGITFIPLPQTVYTGTIGSEGGENRAAIVDLGTLNPYKTPQNVFAYHVNCPTNGTVICSSYKTGQTGATPTSAEDKTVFTSNFIGTYYPIIIKDSAYANATVEEFKTAMSGVQLLYQLDTPSEFAVTAPTIPTPTGSATTWATAEDGTIDSMEVTYVGRA